MKGAIYTGLLILMLAACKKNNNGGAAGSGNDITNRLTYIIDDNKFNFSFFNTGLRRTDYQNLLAGPGPYTVLVPDNNAFIAAGYASEQQVLTEKASVLNSLIPYHILSGTWELNKLPYIFNQEINSISGSKMYVTHWIKNGDTVLTINGTPILTYNLPASNGLIQVLNNVLQPLLQDKLSDALAADSSLTFLNVALQQANLKGMLAGSKAFTFFAPNNNAFRALGYPSIDSIQQTNPDLLHDLLLYQLFAGRKFIYDYILTTDATDQADQAMLNGDNAHITLLKTGVLYSGITIKGTGNALPANIVKGNLLAGNGVFHIIDQVLKENQ